MNIASHIFSFGIKLASCLIIVIGMSGCHEIYDPDFISNAPYGNNPGNRVMVPNDRRVLLMYLAGYNSLSDCLRDDLNDVMNGWLPGTDKKDNVLLVYTHQPKRDGMYSVRTNPYLLRISAGPDGTTRVDTLVTYPETSISASTEQVNTVLTYVKNKFPAKSYGMTFSSHSTGYLPVGFYGKPDSYTYPQKRNNAKGTGQAQPKSVPFYEPYHDPSLPRVRSLGQDQQGGAGSYISYEMDIRDFADAIPMKLEYLIFDACLMGGIEVAYELREKCGKIGFSQAEVLAEGLDYTKIMPHLLGSKEASLESICYDYFTHYDSQQDVFSRSATISLVDCSRLDTLAETCRRIFMNHRNELSLIAPYKVQRFYRSGHHWFYDLESIISNAGATSDEMKALHDALGACVLYKAHTPQFMCEFDIKTFSGFSMYLPCNGTPELDKYYRTLEWNQATGLVI